MLLLASLAVADPEPSRLLLLLPLPSPVGGHPIAVPPPPAAPPHPQVTLKLENYYALGDGFKALAREYGAVRQQLGEAKGMLAKFDDLKHELADTWHE